MEALGRGEPAREELGLPGGWRVAILPVTGANDIRLEDNELRLYLSRADADRLKAPASEGVYFETAGPERFRYYIEKDFPCAHPRAAEAAEPATETFAPPPGFNERKRASA